MHCRVSLEQPHHTLSCKTFFFKSGDAGTAVCFLNRGLWGTEGYKAYKSSLACFALPITYSKQKEKCLYQSKQDPM